jgi:hypothetical protein
MLYNKLQRPPDSAMPKIGIWGVYVGKQRANENHWEKEPFAINMRQKQQSQSKPNGKMRPLYHKKKEPTANLNLIEA